MPKTEQVKPSIVDINEAENGKNYVIALPVVSALNPAQFAVFNKEYQTLKLNTATDSTQIIQASQFGDGQIDYLLNDLEFLINNPRTPVSNITSRLDNYRPTNDSQQELLNAAWQFLTDLDPSRSQGMYITGSTGVGKTHIAIGLAKALMMMGDYRPVFVSGDRRQWEAIKRRLIDGDFNSQNVLIIDDVNSPYDTGWDIAKKAALQAYDTGMKLFVTSNTPYEEMLAHGFVTDKEEKPRYLSRTNNLFRFFHVQAEDYRQRQ